MATTESDLLKLLRENPVANQFVPYCHLHKESDALTVYFEGDPDYSERLNDHVTLYRSLETDEVIGCRIKGISSLIEDLPNYVHVNHGGVELSVIFLAYRGSVSDAQAGKTLNDLATTAREKKLTLEPCL